MTQLGWVEHFAGLASNRGHAIAYLRFASRRRDSFVHLVNCHRNPRFLQTDPIGYGGGFNLYAYVLNDPVNWIDPLGLMTPAECELLRLKLLKEGKEGIVCGHRDQGGGTGGGVIHPGQPTGPQPGPGGGHPGRPRPETPYCKKMRENSDAAQSMLPPRVTNQNTWNDPAALDYFRLGYLDNVSDLKYGQIGGGVLLVFIGAAFQPAGTIGAGLGGVAGGWGLTEWQEHYQEMADAVEDRINYVEARQDGTC